VDEEQLQSASDGFLKNVQREEEQSKKDLESLEAKRAQLRKDIESGLEIIDDEAS
jgi:hypothetical protein